MMRPICATANRRASLHIADGILQILRIPLGLSCGLTRSISSSTLYLCQ